MRHASTASRRGVRRAKRMPRGAVRLAILLAGVLGTGCHSVRATRPAPAPATRVRGELLVGSYGAHHPEVESYRGIPYAAPPVAELRWAAPQPARPRSGTQAANHYAPACYQDNYNGDWYRALAKSFDADARIAPDPRFSEDCLYLNVWTPRHGAGARLPVMVWIHGGSNKAGWSFESNYVGENLAAQGQVVVVSIAYRLGVFGFFGHPELRSSPTPANFGLLDQVAALGWVHDSIAAFGGDPANVTVFGESAGGADITYLLASPRATGLFRRAITESGGYALREDVPLAQAEQVGVAIAGAFAEHPNLAQLRAKPAAEVFRAARESLPGHDYGPVVDGRVVTQAPARAFRARGVGVDLLTGSNDNEYYMYVDGDPSLLAAALAALPRTTQAPLAARAASEPTVRLGHDRSTALVDMACPTYLIAQSARRAGHRAWVYRFTRVRPGAGGAAVLAYHGAEIPYVFDTHDDWLSADAGEPQLTRVMMAYWTNFARTGDPNGATIPAWPEWDPTHPRLQRLDAATTDAAPPDLDLCLLLAPDLYPGWQR